MPSHPAHIDKLFWIFGRGVYQTRGPVVDTMYTRGIHIQFFFAVYVYFFFEGGGRRRRRMTLKVTRYEYEQRGTKKRKKKEDEIRKKKNQTKWNIQNIERLLFLSGLPFLKKKKKILGKNYVFFFLCVCSSSGADPRCFGAPQKITDVSENKQKEFDILTPVELWSITAPSELKVHFVFFFLRFVSEKKNEIEIF